MKHSPTGLPGKIPGETCDCILLCAGVRTEFPYTVRMILPMFSPLSIMAWAWAAWASGKVAWTIGLMAPCSSNGQARSRARAMAP